MHYRSEKWLHHYQTKSLRWNEKIVLHFNEQRCIDCWGKACHLNYHIRNDQRNFNIFFLQSSLYVSFKWHHTKVPASSSWPMKIVSFPLNITFIQLSTRHNCFSLAYSYLIFFCLYVTAVFLLLFLLVNFVSLC